MSSPVNSGWDLTSSGTAIIPLNRWSRVAYSVQVASGQVTVEGTITEINRADPLTGVYPTPVWNVLTDNNGDEMSDIAPGIFPIIGYALTAVRIVETNTSTAVGRFMQQGEAS